MLAAGHVLHVTSGRVGIALALKHARIGAGHKVLVPAYHCTSMVEPVIWAGAEPVFYRITPDTRIDFGDIERKLDGSVRLLIATHYYGFPQDLTFTRAFCDRHRLLLLEDCAHAFFGSDSGRPIGSTGEYAIASTMKFFPIYEGGCLASSKFPIDRIPLRDGGWKFQIKSVVNVLESSMAYRRLRPLGLLLRILLWLKSSIWRLIKSQKADVAPHGAGPGAADGSYDFDPRWIDTAMSRVSRVILRLAGQERVVTRRRQNYEKLLRALNALPGARPLFPALPANVVPYVFPLIVDEPARIFPILKNAGVPILRFGEFLWQGVDTKTCAVSADYSRRVFQFPCHQELRAAEIDWMITMIRAAVLGTDRISETTKPAKNS